VIGSKTCSIVAASVLAKKAKGGALGTFTQTCNARSPESDAIHEYEVLVLSPLSDGRIGQVLCAMAMGKPEDVSAARLMPADGSGAPDNICCIYEHRREIRVHNTQHLSAHTHTHLHTHTHTHTQTHTHTHLHTLFTHIYEG